MDKTTTLGLAAAMSALVAMPAAADAPAGPAVPQAQSVSELLDPIPDAGARLQLADAQEAAQARLIEAQYAPPAHHHHHHWRRRRHHHHHHHHHSNY